MQTLRKKSSPLKYKNETTRFLGEGVSFKAKLIGILEVSEARGDRMCQEALSDLKMAIRAAGEHKQRITVNIALDGLRLRDEKTGDSLYHHPVHKISFIAQDMTDSRAFGYIFGSPDTGHRFFGIKTDKAASQVVISMRDLFQVVFTLKKKEIELAKEHLQKTYLPISLPFSEHGGSTAKPHDKSSRLEHKMTGTSTHSKPPETAVADLVDLELELNSLQQGLHQMERITPSDPFGDSFITYQKLILPPPPSSNRERSNRTTDSSGIARSRTPPSAGAISSDSATDTFFSSKTNKELFANDFSNFPEDPGGSGEWFTPFTSSSTNNVFDESAPVTTTIAPSKDEKHEIARQEIMSQFDFFTELDPLGTGRSKPYIDKKNFFQELKKPPKKALNELASTSTTTSTTTTQDLFNINFNPSAITTTAPSSKPEMTAPVYSNTINPIASDPFGDDPFVKEDPFADTDFSKQDPFEIDFVAKDSQNNLSKTPKAANSSDNNELTSSGPNSPKTLPTNNDYATLPSLVDDQKPNNLSPLNLPDLETSTDVETAPEPPPRPITVYDIIRPPPLPPKKQNDITIKPPPRPPVLDDHRYAILQKNDQKYQKKLELKDTDVDSNPPIPAPQRKSKFDSELDKDTPPERPKKYSQISNEDEGYLTPISFNEKFKDILPMSQTDEKTSNNDKASITEQFTENHLNCSLEGLDMTLTQLTLSGLNELAAKLKIPPHKLSNMTLVQLTNYLSTFIKAQSIQERSDTNENNFANFEANFDNVSSNIAVSNIDPTYDRYAVFRELQEEIKQTKINSEQSKIDNNTEEQPKNVSFDLKALTSVTPVKEDRYAALREIVEISTKEEPNEKLSDAENNVEETKNKNLINEEQEKNIENVNLINKQHDLLSSSAKDCLIEYVKENTTTKEITPEKSPSLRSPLVKTPIATDDIIPTNRRTSGSLSDILSGSSPEIDNTGSNSDIPKKNLDPTVDSWAIFDPNTVPIEIKESNVGIPQSEDGVSPWSSDSKEFGNKSPTQWKKSSKSSKKKTEPENWWPPDVRPTVEVEAPYYPPNRRFPTTDPYDEEYYEFYQRPHKQHRHHHKQNNENWQQEIPMTLNLRESGAQTYHSSSSRDASPYDEEPRRQHDERLVYAKPNRVYYEKHRDVKHADSWDEEDDEDYRYNQEYKARAYYQRRDSNEILEGDRYDRSEYDAERRFRRRRDGSRERKEWRHVEWVDHQVDHQAVAKFGRYSSRKANLPPEAFDKRLSRERYEEIYRTSREPQPDSPWEEDEYANEVEQVYAQQQHYLAAKKNWKQRPSSASEMDRKSGEIKSRHHLGGSDGERDRRYKTTRRSRSRDSQITEAPHRYKTDTATLRNLHRSRPPKSIEADYPEIPSNKIIIDKNIMKDKKIVSTRKKPKEKEGVISGFPRKALARAKSLFSSDSQRSNDNFVNRDTENQFKFDNDYGYSESENFGDVNRSLKGARQGEFPKKQVRIDKNLNDRRMDSLQELKLLPRYQTNPESPFEDDFALVEKTEHIEGNNISSIKEEPDFQEGFNNQYEFTLPDLTNPTINGRKRLLSKNMLPGMVRNDANLKKSESVNIFTTENDPFDDEFFSFQRDFQKDSNNEWRQEFEDTENTKHN